MKNNIYSILFLLSLTLNAYAQTWNSIGPGLNAAVAAIAIDENNVYAGGLFTDAGGDPDADYLARWDGHEWHAVGSGINGAVHAIAIQGDNIFVGGEFTLPFNHIAKWDGVQWVSLNDGLDGVVFDIKLDGADVYVGGSFNGKIRVWKGNSWRIVGAGLNSTVNTIEINGTDIYVGGSFTNAGGNILADRIAKWNGHSWENLGPGFPRNSVTDIAVHGTYVYVCGDFNDCAIPFHPEPYILKWDGKFFRVLGNAKECRSGSSMCFVGDYLYVGVIDYFSADAGIHRCNLVDDSWEYFTGSWIIDNQNYYSNITLASSGNNLYAGHSFTNLGSQDGDNIARWGELISATGIVINKDHLHVFPNPFRDIIYYSFGDEVSCLHTLTLLDAMGKVVFRKHSEECELNIAPLPAGMYYLNVETNGLSDIAKIVKY